jgi:hypothetical protein
VCTDVHKRAETHGSDYFDDADCTKSDIQWLAGKAAQVTKDEYWKITVNAPGGTRNDWGSRRDKETRIERRKNSITRRSIQKVFISGLTHPLGKVLVSSGKLVSPASNESLLDWVLVELDERWTGLEAVPPLAVELFRQDRPVWFGIETHYLPSMSSDAFTKSTEFSDVKCGDYYIKRGRTTDVTAGVYHGTEAHIKWSVIDQKLHSESNQPVNDRARGRRYKEFAIVNKKGYSRIINYNPPATREYDVRTQASFCVAGDEGSIVWDVDGEVAGLLTLGNAVRYQGRSRIRALTNLIIFMKALGLVPAALADIARKTTFREGDELIQGVLSLP